jgi:Holliday junction resolvase RusA-like endonuclease
VIDLADELLGPAQRAAERAAEQLPRWWTTIGEPISFTILGAPVPHKNGYHIVTIGNHPAIVKSKEALSYERDALLQIPPQFRLRLEVPVAATLRIWYATERPDLDESLILDVLQDRWDRKHGPYAGSNKRQLVQAGVYRNDRQVREKHVFHGVDARNPRAEITIQPLIAQQTPLF